MPVCPVGAIFFDDDVPARWSVFTADNAAFFSRPLPGQPDAVASPSGASKVGRLGIDTVLVAGFPPSTEPGVPDKAGQR